MKIPKSHPRYKSLMTRERLIQFLEQGIVVREGLIAHGRGEAFDYLIGERTIDQAEKAEKAAAAHLLLAKNAVLSVNGNTAALAAKEIIALGDLVPAKIEVNVFYGDRDRRVKLIADFLRNEGAKTVLGEAADARIEGLEHGRALCSQEGIFSADVVLVPLEDGDRAEALVKMDKTTIAIDLNPLSRTSKCATISIVDDVKRALTNIYGHINYMKQLNKEALVEITKIYDNDENLKDVLQYMDKRLQEL